MPSKVSQHFLGLQLSVDSLRAAIVDEQLELVGSEHVDFDSEFPEYQTRAGVHVSPGDVYMTSVEIWLRALDILFERLQRNYELAKIKAISGAAQVGSLSHDSANKPRPYSRGRGGTYGRTSVD
ncbi:hypothetical protein FRB91_011774 [Serendipita sp. 411]|nr:hypothetical protein FRB91_011774 [Serendipita sp. 411]